MPKPRLRWPYNALQEQLADAMLQGPRALRHPYPQTESEMRGAVLALLAIFEFATRITPLTLIDMVEVHPPDPPAPPDPFQPEPTDSRLADELLAALVGGLHECRPDLDFPESRSDLDGCACEILARFNVRRRETPNRVADMAWPQAPNADRAIAPTGGNPEPIA